MVKQKKYLLGTRETEEIDMKGKLGGFFGVYVPVCLSILSVILFLRFGWVLGQTGFLEGVFMVVLACMMTLFTILSISAIATNGRIKGGGCYFMISRALGPEFGGSIGLIFYCANVFAAVLYLAGFAESLSNTLNIMIYNDYLTKLIIGSTLCIVLTGICLVGASLYAKTTFITFIFVMLAVVFTFISFFLQKPGHIESYTGFSLETFFHNLMPGYQYDKGSGQVMNFRTVFAIFFPACTGIMAGVNMSGDLKNPARAIPVYTLSAFGTTCFVYLALMTLMAFTTSRDGPTGLRDNMPIIQAVAITPFGKWIIASATWVVTLAAALASLIGASRVLQALARDHLIPFLGIFGIGSGKTDEPRIGVIATYLLAQSALFVGNLNLVAPIDSMFFLMSYSIVNLACFVHLISGAPNFRPLWPFVSKWTALIGCIGSTALMFIAQPLWASVSFIAMIVLFVFIHYRAPVTGWGDIAQALIYHQVRKYLLRLDVSKDHVKYWRPQLLLLDIGRVSRSTLPLAKFCNNLKKGGLYVVGTPVVGDSIDETIPRADAVRAAWSRAVKTLHLKAFGEAVTAPTTREGAANLLATAGLGFMKPNTVVVELFNPRRGQAGSVTRLPPQVTHTVGRGTRVVDVTEVLAAMTETSAAQEGREPIGLGEYIDILNDCHARGKNLVITRNFETYDEADILTHTRPLVPFPLSSPTMPRDHMFVDVWLFPLRLNPYRSMVTDDVLVPSQELALLFAMMLGRSTLYEDHTKLRVCSVFDSSRHITKGAEVVDKKRGELHDQITCILKDLRIKAAVHIIDKELATPAQTSVRLFTDDGADYEGTIPAPAEEVTALNTLIRRESGMTAATVLTLPIVPGRDVADDWLAVAEPLTRNLPPTVMIHSKNSIITTNL